MTDWAEWSREAVRIMQARNEAWQSRFELVGNAYRWDRDTATIVFERQADDVVATLTVAGTTSASEGTFLWAWANPSIPEVARHGLEHVRAFGAQNELSLLTEAESPGGRAEGLEMAALAGRITNAEGVFVDEHEDIVTFLLLRQFRLAGRN